MTRYKRPRLRFTPISSHSCCRIEKPPIEFHLRRALSFITFPRVTEERAELEQPSRLFTRTRNQSRGKRRRMCINEIAFAPYRYRPRESKTRDRSRVISLPARSNRSSHSELSEIDRSWTTPFSDSLILGEESACLFTEQPREQV